MDICIQVIEAIAAPIERVFDVATSLATPPKVFKGFGPIPAILKAEMIDGGEMREGAIRRVTNADGSVIDEEILTLIKPQIQAYKLIRGFIPPVSYLIVSGDSEWKFTPTTTGTQITWNFCFQLTSPLVYPPMLLIMKVFFKTALKRCLGELKLLLEQKDA